MSTPIKNGVILYLCEYRCYLRADVYRLDGYGWLFRVNNNCEYCPDDDEDFKILFVDDWFGQSDAHGTITAPDQHVTVSGEFTAEYLTSGEDHDDLGTCQTGLVGGNS